MNTTGKVVIGVVAGAATGAILGILFAPDKGSETRKKIAKKTNDIKNGVQGKFTDFLENVKEKVEPTKGQDHGIHGVKEKSKMETV